jgi:hypothetical protein
MTIWSSTIVVRAARSPRFRGGEEALDHVAVRAVQLGFAGVLVHRPHAAIEADDTSSDRAAVAERGQIE